MKAASILQTGIEKLAQAGIENPRLDARLLLEHATKLSQAEILRDQDLAISEANIKTFFNLIKKRSQHIPLAYLTKHKEFFGYDFMVSKSVLIPRPETEILVEWTRELLQNINGKKDKIKIADIGTGSGAIIISLALTLNNNDKYELIATDLSKKALFIAEKNAAKHNVKIKFYNCDLAKILPNDLDMVISNPPYLSEAELENCQLEIKFEPELALNGGIDGLSVYRNLLYQLKVKMNRDGQILLECAPSQTKEIIKIAKKVWPLCGTEIRPDLAGLDRCLRISNLC
ncbi:MAG: peptide chain release factor N(5)-glutamine methyltransferase [Patescibacteria group bacterium]|nr:peptide chain release factor N(5)-glutamine methyltransferase [Patescibacteria group bacterium]